MSRKNEDLVVGAIKAMAEICGVTVDERREIGGSDPAFIDSLGLRISEPKHQDPPGVPTSRRRYLRAFLSLSSWSTLGLWSRWGHDFTPP